MPMVCSAVVTVLPPGVFMTTTPFLVAAGISTLSRPLPARPTTLSFAAFSSRPAVTLVADRMMSASYSPMIFSISSTEVLLRASTSSPAFLSMSTPTGARLSLMRTFMIPPKRIYRPPPPS